MLRKRRAVMRRLAFLLFYRLFLISNHIVQCYNKAIMKDQKKLFDTLIQDMYHMDDPAGYLEECMSLNQAAMKSIPLRFRIIALGFVKHFSLEELNRALTEHGCPALYSRNFWEAILIFALKNGLSYESWRDLSRQCMSIYSGQEDDRWFPEKKITYQRLEAYVLGNSVLIGDLAATEQRTVLLQQKLNHVENDPGALQMFLENNIRSFSSSREKTRYYFCKYLYYYLNQKVEAYFDACRKKRGIEDALSEMVVIKAVTKLRRNLTMPEDEKRELIRSSAISCGELFDSFNFFYFEYVSMDWAEIMLECYSRPDQIPQKHRTALARAFRSEDKAWAGMSDEQVIQAKMDRMEEILDEAYSLDGTGGHGKSRAGENTVYKYIKGTLDIDRTVLICFLLFFDANADIPAEHRLTVERLNTILLNCGYAQLNTDNDFDWIIAEYFESPHRQDFLNDIIVDYAHHQENTFIYQIYRGAVNYRDQLEDLLVQG